MQIFNMEGPDGGVICSICKVHGTDKSRVHEEYISIPGFPVRKIQLIKHMNSAVHMRNCESHRLQQKSSFHARAVVQNLHKHEIVAKRMQQIFWLVKNEIANRKLSSLQQLFDNVVDDYMLSDFKHTSSTSVLGMIRIMSDYFTSRTIAAISRSRFWSTMVDESSDISVFQQYITFVRFVSDSGKAETRFLDIRQIHADRATAKNLLNTWKQVASDYGLDQRHHVAISCDVAAAMLGKHNGMATQLQSEIGTMVTIHCHAHRLALTAADSCEQLETFKSAEHLLLQLWKFFASSPLRTSKLAEFQAEQPNKAKKLQRACRTRWLSCNQAVTSCRAELSSLFACLNYYTDRGDATATGLLTKMKNIDFIFALYILESATEHLATLCKTFQLGEYNFSQVKSSLQLCVSQLTGTVHDDLALQNIKADWPRLSANLGDFNPDFEIKIRSLSRLYVETTCERLSDRFPEPEILSAFSIFEPSLVPSDSHRRKLYGIPQVQLLEEKFGPLMPENCSELIIAEWQIFREKLTLDFENADAAGDVCRRLVRNSAYACLPCLLTLARIALCIPMSTAWPERGFSLLKRIKRRDRNKLLPTTLQCLMNISLNGKAYDLLPDDFALEMASNWIASAARRNVAERHPVLVPDVEEQSDDPDEEFCELDANDFVDTEHFIL